MVIVAPRCNSFILWREGIERVDEDTATIVATVEEVLLAPSQALPTQCFELAGQAGNADVGLPSGAQLHIISCGIACGLPHNVIHHVALRTLDMDRLGGRLDY